MQSVKPFRWWLACKIYERLWSKGLTGTTTCKMGMRPYKYRQPQGIEKDALRVLYHLATKIPKVILQRVEEIVPDIKPQMMEYIRSNIDVEKEVPVTSEADEESGTVNETRDITTDSEKEQESPEIQVTNETPDDLPEESTSSSHVQEAADPDSLSTHLQDNADQPCDAGTSADERQDTVLGTEQASIKEEQEEIPAEEFSLFLEDLSAKSEVKEEITFEEHEICIEDVEDIGSIYDYDMGIQAAAPDDEEAGLLSSAQGSLVQSQVTSVSVSQSEMQMEDNIITIDDEAKVIYIKRIKDEVLHYEPALSENTPRIRNAVPTASRPTEGMRRNVSSEENRKVAADSSKCYLNQKRRPHTCIMCSKKFLNTGTLKLHYKLHSREREHKCRLCGKVLSDSYKLYSHMETHSEYLRSSLSRGKFPVEKQLTCDTCNGAEKPYRCELCSVHFGSVDALEMHVRVHGQEKPHRCVLCDRTFTEEQFIQHLRLHCNEYTHVCRKCNENFSSLASLKTHSRVHMNEQTQINVL
ncbi:zinc finger and SCAN domain-containing protein 21-like isoform X1 [Periplaneta americana]|uniref:zinc finger and SCAN domain-containing protein 21-like isoform X1 n=2 Tax=Periplaneta americana TaxID=6978 RepID=UPI0037E7CDD3